MSKIQILQRAFAALVRETDNNKAKARLNKTLTEINSIRILGIALLKINLGMVPNSQK